MHSPITRNGPIYSIYGNGRCPVAVYRTCCAKGSKAQSTVTHADPTHSGTRGFCLPVLAARHEHLCFTICTQKKKGLPIVPCRILNVPVIRMQFDEIHINSHEIRTKFVRISYEFRANFT